MADSLHHFTAFYNCSHGIHHLSLAALALQLWQCVYDSKQICAF